MPDAEGPVVEKIMGLRTVKKQVSEKSSSKFLNVLECGIKTHTPTSIRPSDDAVT